MFNSIDTYTYIECVLLYEIQNINIDNEYYYISNL